MILILVSFFLLHIFKLKEGIMMESFVQVIGNVGFPIAISLYLLMRIEGKLEVLSNSINNLSNVMSKFDK